MGAEYSKTRRQKGKSAAAAAAATKGAPQESGGRQQQQQQQQPSASSQSLFGGVNDSGAGVDEYTAHYLIPRSALKLGKSIGSGSFGVVNEGFLHGTRVAVKTIQRDSPENMLDEEAAVESFKREAALNCKLRHPNITLAMGTVVESQVIMIVTEFLERGTVRALLVSSGSADRFPLSPIRINWALDTARGMAYLHSLSPPIIHRDLKTTNLLVDRGYNVKICDFGLSRFMAADSIMSSVGTVQFAAPEVLKQDVYTEKADVFSMGSVLWELWTRRRIFKGVPQVDVYRAVIAGEMPPLPSGCDSTYARLVRACWHADPAQRPSFEDMIPTLETVSTSAAASSDETSALGRLLGVKKKAPAAKTAKSSASEATPDARPSRPMT